MASSVSVLAYDNTYEYVLRSAPAEINIVRDQLDADTLVQTVVRYCPPLEGLDADAFVAGGFLRDVIAGTAPRDLDLYVRTRESLTDLESELRRANWTLDRIGMLSTSWRDDRGHSVQLINAEGQQPAECIRRFDLTICCAAVDLRTHETHSCVTFLEDVKQKRLAINKPAFPVDTLRRVARFVGEGYSICSAQLQILHGCVLRELHSHGVNAFRPAELL
jgi:hypothetical protein